MYHPKIDRQILPFTFSHIGNEIVYTNIFLNDNIITFLSGAMFASNATRDWRKVQFHMNRNKIQCLTPDFMKESKMFQIYMEENPLICDCHVYVQRNYSHDCLIKPCFHTPPLCQNTDQVGQSDLLSFYMPGCANSRLKPPADSLTCQNVPSYPSVTATANYIKYTNIHLLITVVIGCALPFV